VRFPFALLAAVALTLAGCVTPPPVAPPAPPPVAAPPPTLPARYEAVAWSALPGWGADRVAEAWPAFRAGCVPLADDASSGPVWRAPCAAAATIDGRDVAAIRAFFESQFTPYRVLAADGADSGTITGYYEPKLTGSRTRTGRFSVPLYAAPDDLLTIDLASLHPDLKDRRLRGRLDGKRVVPYWSRADIERGAAPVADKVLVWVTDPVEAFFLQIQGSGRVELADGGVMRVGYADQNGHPFRSIGRVLIDRGELTLAQASLQGIKAWGQRNPDKLPALLDENPSYVFFREVPAPLPGTLEAEIDGPIGTLGVPLLRERTMAVDPRSVPLGAPVFLATTHPLSSQPLERLVLAQDTGGAIRGAVRGDFFWGFGDEAGRQAGRMKQVGRFFLLWPKGAPLPAAPG
jgi:membrane-bound lytic murein transglycosylase A